MEVVETAHLTTLAAVVGIVAVDPSARLRRATDWSGWLTGQQRVDRVMSRVAPPLFLSATAAAAGASLTALGQHKVALATGRALAAGCVAAAVAVTLVVNEPMNTRLRAWNPRDAPPADWRAVRQQWDRGHRVRRALLAAAAIASAWGTIRSRTDPRGLP
ncbi:hypothetical protein GCM10009616_37660 [Microlunatus lacustris]